jgi:hypothetical protein
MSEDVPATPGWVEDRLDDLLTPEAGLPDLPFCRGTYLDCLARCRLPADPEAGRDRCRAAFLACLEGAGVEADRREALEHRLLALEAEIGEDT